MLESLLGRLTDLLGGSPAVAAAGAFAWGACSILLSPCHLSSIPLLVGYLAGSQTGTAGGAWRRSAAFALGILAAIAAVGIATAGAGRIMGSLGPWGDRLAAVVFLLFGLHLMGLVPLDWSLPRPATRPSSLASSAGIGLLFGVALGPCTFAFLAPVLALVFARAGRDALSGLVLLAAFAAGHCGVIVAAGTATGAVQNYLRWTGSRPAARWVRRVCGALVGAAGVWLLARW